MGDDSSSALSPAYVPFAGDKGGERLHVKLRRQVEGVQRAAVAVHKWVGEIGESLAAAGTAIGMGTPTNVSPVLPQPAGADDGTAWALCDGDRVDWMLQETELEVANEYLSAFQAHTSYFENADVVQFVCEYVVGVPRGGMDATTPA